MRAIMLFVAIGLLAVAGGCTDRQSTPKTVANPPMRAIEKARAIEGQMAESAARNRAAIENSDANRNDP